MRQQIPISRTPLVRQMPILRQKLRQQIPISRTPLVRQMPILRQKLRQQIPISRTPLVRQMPILRQKLRQQIPTSRTLLIWYVFLSNLWRAKLLVKMLNIRRCWRYYNKLEIRSERPLRILRLRRKNLSLKTVANRPFFVSVLALFYPSCRHIHPIKKPLTE